MPGGEGAATRSAVGTADAAYVRVLGRRLDRDQSHRGLTYLRAETGIRADTAGDQEVLVERFDFRNLNPPEPLNRALQLADGLLPGQCLAVLTPFWPMPLLQALANRGLVCSARMLEDGGCEVCIEAERGPD